MAYRVFWTEADTLEYSSSTIRFKAIWSSTEIFVKSNTIPLTDPKNGGGAQLAQDCLDLAPVADAAADHLHDGACKLPLVLANFGQDVKENRYRFAYCADGI